MLTRHGPLPFRAAVRFPVPSFDMVALRRAKGCKRSLLTEGEVKDIFGLKYTHGLRSIHAASVVTGERYNVAPKTIRDIWNGRCWLKATLELWRDDDPLKPDLSNIEAKRKRKKIQKPPSSTALALKSVSCHNSKIIHSEIHSTLSRPPEEFFDGSMRLIQEHIRLSWAEQFARPMASMQHNALSRLPALSQNAQCREPSSSLVPSSLAFATHPLLSFTTAAQLASLVGHFNTLPH
mmetsp:Transcript_65740/g.176146  ORF Transcript_65740/g.176146 Transcript_65740/m.176146 type:complete len:236 (-) Transcript_65740:1228-1935(-)